VPARSRRNTLRRRRGARAIRPSQVTSSHLRIRPCARITTRRPRASNTVRSTSASPPPLRESDSGCVPARTDWGIPERARAEGSGLHLRNGRDHPDRRAHQAVLRCRGGTSARADSRDRMPGDLQTKNADRAMGGYLGEAVVVDIPQDGPPSIRSRLRSGIPLPEWRPHCRHRVCRRSLRNRSRTADLHRDSDRRRAGQTDLRPGGVVEHERPTWKSCPFWPCHRYTVPFPAQTTTSRYPSPSMSASAGRRRSPDSCSRLRPARRLLRFAFMANTSGSRWRRRFLSSRRCSSRRSRASSLCRRR